MSTTKVNTLSNVAGTHSVLVEDLAKIFKDFATNSDAITGGLVVGNLYYNTTDSKVTKVV